MNSLYQDARATFEAYCALTADDLPEDCLSALQVKLCRWELANFGWQPATMHALGIGEEVGELLESLDDDETRDAIGDTFVYASQLATDHRLDFGTIIRRSSHHRTPRASDISIAVGRLNHAVLKASQGIRGFDDNEKTRDAVCTGLLMLCNSVSSYCRYGFNVREAWIETAESVLQRNWVKSKADGLTS